MHTVDEQWPPLSSLALPLGPLPLVCGIKDCFLSTFSAVRIAVTHWKALVEPEALAKPLYVYWLAYRTVRNCHTSN